MGYWLLKSEPDVFGIDHLRDRPDQTEPWDGVRNYQARNMLRDQMRVGDLGLFYHSNCTVPGIVGIVQIVREGYPDLTQFDPDAKYFDPKSNPANPRWYRVDVRYKRHTRRVLPLAELRTYADGPLADLPLLRKGNRLSVMPVTPAQWEFILALENR
jgi:predicted RNA-binding protein with PUA-like domain